MVWREVLSPLAPVLLKVGCDAEADHSLRLADEAIDICLCPALVIEFVVLSVNRMMWTGLAAQLRLFRVTLKFDKAGILWTGI